MELFYKGLIIVLAYELLERLKADEKNDRSIIDYLHALIGYIHDEKAFNSLVKQLVEKRVNIEILKPGKGILH